MLSVVYVYAWIIATVVWAFFWWRIGETSYSLLQTICIYGYSMSGYNLALVSAFLCFSCVCCVCIHTCTMYVYVRLSIHIHAYINSKYVHTYYVHTYVFSINSMYRIYIYIYICMCTYVHILYASVVYVV